MTRAAVIGCGDVSIVHLQAIAKLDGAVLAGVCDTDPGRAAAAGARFSVPHFKDHEEMLSAVRPDVVHICTPHDQHVEVALSCLAAGTAVLLEKPVANTVESAARLLASPSADPRSSSSTELRSSSSSADPVDVDDLGTTAKIGICLQNRYNATSRAARDLITSGAVGAVLGGSATVMWHRDEAYYRARPWRGVKERSGGGVLINQAIHTLDLLEWLIGDVTRVRGHAHRLSLQGIDVEDTASAVLDHAGGARSVFFATVANTVDSPVSIEIVTERAVLLIRGDLTVRHADGRIETVAEPIVSTGGRSYWGASHELLIADFYRTLPAPEPFWISPAEGIRSLRLIEQIYSC